MGFGATKRLGEAFEKKIRALEGVREVFGDLEELFGLF